MANNEISGVAGGLKITLYNHLTMLGKKQTIYSQYLRTNMRLIIGREIERNLISFSGFGPDGKRKGFASIYLT